MRSDIYQWIKEYPHCRLTFHWRRRDHELMFSWPVSSPFAIIHVDLWMPGKYTDSNSNMALMNAMCDMSQFVVVVSLTNESSATLAENFFQHVLIKFDVCHLVVIDDGTQFKGAFVVMCTALDLNYDIFAKRNHKGSTVEHFLRYLNKTMAIAMENHQSNDVFVPAGIAVGYAWNSAPIDDTEILRSTVAIGHEFRFPIDINLSGLPQLTQNNDQSTIDYLRLTDSNRRFSSSILKILIEYRRTMHVERVNNNENIVELIVGDIVMARTTVQSDAFTNKVANLSYQVRRPFRIVKCTSHGSYLVQKLYKPNSPELKFVATDLYPLSPSLKPCESVYSSNIRYLNHSHSPIVNPLNKPLNIELYNDTWSDKPPRTSQPLFDYIYPTLAFLDDKLAPFT